MTSRHLRAVAPAGPAPRHRAPSVTATVTALAAVAIVVVGQTSIAIPLMPALAASWHVPTSAAAWATTTFAAAYALGALASGPLSDRYTRRLVVTASLTGMAVATALIPLAQTLLTGSTLRALQGLLAGAFAPMAYAHLAEHVPARRLPLALTTLNAACAVTVIAAQLQGQILESVVGWRGVFLLSAPLTAVCAIAVWKTLRPGRPGGPAAEPATTPPAPRRPVRGLLPVYAVTLTVIGTLTALYTGIQLYGPAGLATNADAMFALRASAIPAMLAAVLLAPLLGRIPAAPRAAAALAVTAAGLLAAAAAARSVIGLALALALVVLAISTVGPALVQIIGQRAGPARSTALGIYSFVLNLGAAGGAQLPRLLESLSQLALCTAGVLAAGAALIALALRPPTRRRSTVSAVPDSPAALFTDR